MNSTDIKVFQKIVWNYYTTSGRGNLPWRSAQHKASQSKQKLDPYRVWVSEVMLQQTQVDRVIPFFTTWMHKFPTVQKLAAASQIDILKLWKGLGYNSRALRMKQCAQEIVKNYRGKFPKIPEELQKLPGIGPYTAGAIVAFAYDQPTVMIETNIRRVFIHHFFEAPSTRGGQGGVSVLAEKTRHTSALMGTSSRRGGSTKKIPPRPIGTPPKLGGDEYKIHDAQILELVQKTLPTKNVREWYWALMDYGAFLGRTLNISGKKYNPNVQSKHYTKQSKFIGSDRQIRGKVLEILLAQKSQTIQHKKLVKLVNLVSEYSTDQNRIQTILKDLQKDGFVTITKSNIELKK